MKNLIANFDFLGKQESLRINGQKRHRTLFGGIISTLIVLICCSISFYLIFELFSNDDPKVFDSKNINKNPKNFSISKNGIQLFLSLEYSNSTYYIDETIYTVSAIFSLINFKHENGSLKQYVKEEELKMVKCSEIYTYEEIQKLNINFPHKLFYCFPPDNLYLNGIWGSEFFSSIKVTIKKCNNSKLDTNNLPCKPIEYINSIINYGIVSLMVTDYLIDHKNFNEPLSRYLRNNFDRLSDKSSINYLINFSNYIYKTDKGLIFNQYEIINAPIIGDFKNSYNFGETNVIAFFQLQCNSFEITNIRSYLKLQDILTKIGGIVKCLMLIGMFINYFYSQAFSTFENVFEFHKNSFPTYIEISKSKNLNSKHESLKKIFGFYRQSENNIKFKSQVNLNFRDKFESGILNSNNIKKNPVEYEHNNTKNYGISNSSNNKLIQESGNDIIKKINSKNPNEDVKLERIFPKIINTRSITNRNLQIRLEINKNANNNADIGNMNIINPIELNNNILNYKNSNQNNIPNSSNFAISRGKQNSRINLLKQKSIILFN